jgi:hypothetical protein
MLASMDSWSDYDQRRLTNSQSTATEEQCLYDHLLHQVKTEPPEALIHRFRALFIDGMGYDDPQVWQAIRQIVASPYIEKDFKFILNRSSYILINHWLMQPRLHSAIPELIALYEATPAGQGRSVTTQRLRALVQMFRDTEQYRALQRLAHVVSQTPDWSSSSNKPLGTLVRRYPYLYDYSLLTADSTSEQRRRIRHIRRQAQQQFERDLARYATFKLLEGGSLADLAPPQQRSTKNPTLLSDRQLDKALRQFGGKIDGGNSYRDLAQCFLTYSRQTRCFSAFKHDLYEYLVCAIDSRYGKQQFNQRLYTALRDILPEHDSHPLSDVLLIGTCRRLLNLLVVESLHHPNHATFVDLTGNLGITTTIGLLLKIVLICRKVKPYLERQFAILFRHYETCTRDGVTWLIDSLESLNVAFSIHFGSLSL